MNAVEKAYEFAKMKHEGQKDRAGNDYITHPVWVSGHCGDEDAKITALLHDTVEDTDTTLDEIEENFGWKIRDAVDHVTRRKNEDYLDFVRRSMENPISKEVKMMDLRHNMDLSRIEGEPGEEDLIRMRDKYNPAYRILTGHDLFIADQVPVDLNELTLRSLIWNMYNRRWVDDRANRNMKYILEGLSYAVSDELKNLILEEIQQ